ncbi:Hrp65 protein [Armadillidium vulgare]|nr:Hrp65 protein [Armadillidium vulgare]
MDTQSQQNQEPNIKKEPITPGKTNENVENGGSFSGGRGNIRGGYRGRVYRGGRGGTLDGVLQVSANRGHNGDENAQHNDRGVPGERGGYRGRGRGRGRGGGADGGKYAPQDRITERLKALAGPLYDLPPREEGVKKFSNHCRLWIGNLPLDINEDDVKELFKPYGEFDEVYFDKSKGFAFVRMDYKANAEKSKQELHLKEYKGRQLKIRFSNPGTALKIRNLSPWVTNELLEKAFGVNYKIILQLNFVLELEPLLNMVFGEIEKAIVITDDRGRTTGDGIVEFCKKPCANVALKKCLEGCFFLTTSPRPVIVENQVVVDDNDGMCEVNINKRNPEYLKERQQGPRFAAPGSFEYEYGLKWKQLYELFDKKKEMLEKELQDEKKKLEEQIEYAKYQHETELLREQLRKREEMNQRQKEDFEQRQRDWEEHRRQEEDRQRRIESELSLKFRQQEEELRRRQEENRQFMQERGNELMKSENSQDGFGDYNPEGGGWRRNAEAFPGNPGGSSWRGGSESWNRGGGMGGRGAGAGGQTWADGTWDGRNDPWQNDGRGYGRGEAELHAPACFPVDGKEIFLKPYD